MRYLWGERSIALRQELWWLGWMCCGMGCDGSCSLERQLRVFRLNGWPSQEWIGDRTNSKSVGIQRQPWSINERQPPQQPTTPRALWGGRTRRRPRGGRQIERATRRVVVVVVAAALESWVLIFLVFFSKLVAESGRIADGWRASSGLRAKQVDK